MQLEPPHRVAREVECGHLNPKIRLASIHIRIFFTMTSLELRVVAVKGGEIKFL